MSGQRARADRLGRVDVGLDDCSKHRRLPIVHLTPRLRDGTSVVPQPVVGHFTSQNPNALIADQLSVDAPPARRMSRPSRMKPIAASR